MAATFPRLSAIRKWEKHSLSIGRTPEITFTASSTVLEVTFLGDSSSIHQHESIPREQKIQVRAKYRTIGSVHAERSAGSVGQGEVITTRIQLMVAKNIRPMGPRSGKVDRLHVGAINVAHPVIETQPWPFEFDKSLRW